MLQIIVADFSNLNWRVFAMFVPVFSFVINTWISGNVASSLLVNHSWNYCIGIWAFIFPLACIPLVLCFLHMRYKITNGSNEDKEAWRLLHLEEKEHLRWASWKENIVVDVFWEVDLVGMLMVICLFGFLLVPMTLAGGVHDRWTKASTLVPLVIGFLFIPVFIVWEWKFAKYPMTPFPLLKDRGVWAALCVGSSIYFIWTMPNDYLYTVLVVGMNQTVKSATRISSLYTFTLVITGTIFGLFVIYIKRIKGFIIFGVLLWFVSMGLLIHYRGSSSSGVEYKEYVRGVIGALCLMGFGGGFFTYATQVSITACTNHEYMGVIISIFSALYHLGSALGACVSGAVWTNLLFKTLQNKFEDAGLSSEVATAAYKSPLTFIRTYRWGSPERIQVVLAYSEVQRILCIIGIALCVPLFVVVFFLRDNKLESVQSLELNDKSSISEENIGETVVFSEKEGDYLARKIRLVWRS